MVLQRMADEKKVPDWFLNNGKATETLAKEAKNMDEVKRVSKVSNTPDDQDLVNERDKIEQLAKSNEEYYCKSSWAKEIKKDLKEYATACNMDSKKFKEIDPDNIKQAESEIKMTRTASKNSLGDVFKLDEDYDKNFKDDWQKNKPSDKLNDKPSLLSNTIKSVRGGERVDQSHIPKTARGQNSILDPDAIKRLVEEKEVEHQTLSEERKESKTKQLNEKIAELNKIDDKHLLNNKICLIEASNAKTGSGVLNSKLGGVARFDPNSIDENTEGEKIAIQRDNKNKQTELDKKAKENWENLRGSSASISNDFADSLKKALKK